MKLFFVIFFYLLAFASSQSVTEELVAIQDDLGLSHTFFEVSLFLNRDETLAYMYRIQREVIKAHLNSYAFIKTTALDARDEIEAIKRTELNELCLDAVLNRWSLQYTRYEVFIVIHYIFMTYILNSSGQKLSSCIDVTYKRLTQWNHYLNSLHAQFGKFPGNQVQNLGVKVLTETQIFDDHDSVSTMINQINVELRNLLKHALHQKIQFDSFTRNIYDSQLATIVELVDCDKKVEQNFVQEMALDLERATRCAALDLY